MCLGFLLRFCGGGLTRGKDVLNYEKNGDESLHCGSECVCFKCGWI